MSAYHRSHPTPEMLSRYPCDRDLWLKLRAIGLDMMSSGATKSATPLYAFRDQRSTAGQRNVEWKLNLAEWWSTWEQSGLWQKRGRGRGRYAMCRVGDVGPYEIGNVFIGSCSDNASAANKKQDLPIGVGLTPRSKRNPYTASYSYRGRTIHLGTFETAGAAHQAFLHAAAAADAAEGADEEPFRFERHIGITGYRGIYERRGGYTARITANRRQIWLGHYDCAEDAARAYDAAAIKYHGSSAVLNFPIPAHTEEDAA